MKINSKLMLITATLGLLAASSATAFASGSYVYIENNTNQTFHIKTSWATVLNDGDRMETSLTVPPNTVGSNYDIHTCVSDHHEETNFGYMNYQFYIGNNSQGQEIAEYVVLHYEVAIDQTTNYCHVETGHIYGLSNPDNYQFASYQVGLGNTGTSFETNQGSEFTPNDPCKMYINITPKSTSITKSPMGKISSLLNTIKL